MWLPQLPWAGRAGPSCFASGPPTMRSVGKGAPISGRVQTGWVVHATGCLGGANTERSWRGWDPLNSIPHVSQFLTTSHLESPCKSSALVLASEQPLSHPCPLPASVTAHSGSTWSHAAACLYPLPAWYPLSHRLGCHISAGQVE